MTQIHVADTPQQGICEANAEHGSWQSSDYLFRYCQEHTFLLWILLSGTFTGERKIMDTNHSSTSILAKGNLVYKETTRLLFFGLPWPFTHFRIYETDLVIISGLINIKENDCYMYRISDVELSRNLFQRLFGLSTVTCFTSDVTDRTIVMKNIRHGSEIKDYILQTSEKCRLKRRTVNMQDIGFGSDDIHSVDDMDSSNQ